MIEAKKVKLLPLAIGILVACGANIWVCEAWLQFRQHLLSLPYGTHVRAEHFMLIPGLAEMVGGLIGLPLFLKGMVLTGSQSIQRYGLSFAGILLCLSPMPLLMLFLFTFRNTQGITLY